MQKRGTIVTWNWQIKIQNAAVPYVWIQGEGEKLKVLSNLMVDLQHIWQMLTNGRTWRYTRKYTILFSKKFWKKMTRS